MSHDMKIVYYFVIFYLYCQIFTIYFCQFELLEVLLCKYENIPLLIELNNNLLHKVPLSKLYNQII